jgi:phospholipid transport system substrate-binding protein
MKSAESIFHSVSNPNRPIAGATSGQRRRRRIGRRGRGLSKIVLLLSAALFVIGAVAGPNPPTQLSPEQMVRQTADQVLSTLQKDRPELKAHPGKIYDLVKNIILPHFDFERMSQWVLGPSWRRATPEQREHFVAEFRDLLVNTYGYALLRYENENIQYLPTRGNPASGRVEVRTQIQQPEGTSIPVDYQLYKKQGEWKVFDLSIDGMSLVTNYRSSFADQIQQIGLNGLINRLAQHNQDAAA